MQVPLNWIQELININDIKLDELIERLTLGGFEVEEILEIEVNNKKQTVLDISATANRSDSLSIQGISSEIASLLDKPLSKSDYTQSNLNWKETLKNCQNSIKENLGCSTFLSIELTNITNHTIPSWVKEKLISSGLTPTNTLTDFQSYILLETGYPFAFYDLEKIKKKVDNKKFTFSIEKASANQEFLAVNNINYILSDSNLLVKVNHIPISIAGIIEHHEYSYSNTTNSFLLEGSIFNAAVIRQQSRNLGLRTDRSARYEKSLQPSYLLEACYRLISLLRIQNPKIKCKISTFLQNKEEPLKTLKLNYSTIKEILGPINTTRSDELIFIPIEKVNEYLSRLNFDYVYHEATLMWEVQIPHVRSEDITREIDLIEEVGRLHGFNNFLTTLPKITKIGTEDISYQTRKKITSCFLNLGLNELIHYSLVGKTAFIDDKSKIKLVNPLLVDYTNLRTSLLPSLIQTVSENLKQSNRIIEGFEYGHIFSGNIPNNYQEVEYVAGIFGGITSKLSWSGSQQTLTWFEAKGKMEQLLKQLNLHVNWKTDQIVAANMIFHPYRTAELCLVNGQKLGTFGQIHPASANNYGLSTKMYLFELDLQVIQNQIQKNKLPSFQTYSMYPRIIKDLSFIISKDISFNDLKTILHLNGTKFLSEIQLLDEYQSSSVPEDYTSLCVQLVFQSDQKTLENQEIETIIENLQSTLTTQFNAIIRK
jgi:phenylalanyl-tRNA synthetase beta chain